VRILLTGGSGFLGSHIAEELDRRDVQIRALVRPTSDVRILKALKNVTLVQGTLSDPESLLAAVEGVDGIVHAAGVTKAIRPADFHRTNAQGTDSLIQAARVGAPDLRRLVLVSSLAAVGPSLDGQPVAAGAVPNPVTHYGRSKLAAEYVARAAAESTPITILRPPMIYGPRDREVLPFFQAVKLGFLPLTSPPSTMISAVFVSDCATACVRALSADVPSGSAFFVDDGKTETLGDRIACIENAMDRRARFRTRVPRSLLFGAALATETFGRIIRRPVMLTRDKLNELLAPNWVCDSREAQSALAWEPKVDFAEGSKMTASWYRQAGWL
jgi:nucleoside-diphosphate-sugar epimerase